MEKTVPVVENVPVENIEPAAENIEPATEPAAIPPKRGRPAKPVVAKIKKPLTEEQLRYWALLKQRNSKKKEGEKVVIESDDESSASSSSSSEDEVVTKNSKKVPKKPILKRTYASIPEDTDSDDSSDDGFTFV
jgi:hypothetical protein